MTDTGRRISELLDVESDWTFAPACDGLRHTPTSLLLTPLAETQVVLAYGGTRIDCFDAEDHAVLWAKSIGIVLAHQNSHKDNALVELRRAIGLAE
jgi:hypothetical protein